MNTTWSEVIDGTSIGPTVPVFAEGVLIASVTALWGDEEGVRVSVDYQDGLEDLSGAQALALAGALREVAAMEPPA